MSAADSSTSGRYVCDNCGACCKGHLIVEVEDLDIMREPRLIDADRHHKGKTVVRMLDDYGKGMAVIIAIGKPCPFLDADKCVIYPTRPNCCVGLQAGDDQCQESRIAEGLPPLLPTPEQPIQESNGEAADA
ncbi:MAG: YkgJ family cysteine cluster protein [Pirellulales bacterium]